MKTESDKGKNRFDIVNYILEECIVAYPVSSFVISLYKQYTQRGSLSKKQLQGLFGKASEIQGIDPAKLATLEALINRMPTRYKSDLPATIKEQVRDDGNLKQLEQILEKFPTHKGALVMHAKLKNGGTLSDRERADLSRFTTLIT